MEAHLSSGARAPRRVLSLHLGPSGDERLARLVGAGNERAFAVLYERYHQPLYRYCRSILHDETDAQDALQSTLAGALAALQRGQRDAPVRPWLFRIAHNETITLLRRRRPTVELTEWEEPAGRSTDEQAETRARLAQLVRDLQGLPERQRSALVMRELGGLSHEEIAIALDTSPGAAKQTIFDARRGLFEFSEGRAMACEDVRRLISDGDGRALRRRRVVAHMRDCAGCAAFAGAIPARSDDLRILAPPLAPVAAAGLLASLSGAGTAHGGGGLGAVASAGAGKTLTATLAAKAVVGVAVIAAATAGVSTVLPRASHSGTGAAKRSSSAAPGAGLHRHRAASARARRSAASRHAHRSRPSSTAVGGGVLGAGVSKTGAASALLAHSRGSHTGQQAHEHARHIPSRGSTHSSSRGSTGAQHANEHASPPPREGATKAPSSNREANQGKAAPVTSEQKLTGTPAPGSAEALPSQGSEATTRK
jgi:RNA polymerase sigma factor (sigma-70 family)